MLPEYEHNIKLLLERYDAGKTTLSEEAQLHSFFQKGNVPPELHPYQAEFMHYQTFQSMTTSIPLPIPTPTNAPVSLLKKLLSMASQWYVIVPVVLGIGGVFLISTLAPSESVDQPTAFHETPTPPSPSSMTVVPMDWDSTTTAEADSGTKPLTAPTTPQVPASKGQVISPLVPSPPSAQPQEVPTFAASPIVQEPTPSISEPKVALAETDLAKVTFTLNEQTTDQELMRIARLADEANIEYEYDVNRKKNLINRISVKMAIRGTGKTSTIQVQVGKKQCWESSVGWMQDDTGKAVKFVSGKTTTQTRSDCPE